MFHEIAVKLSTVLLLVSIVSSTPTPSLHLVPSLHLEEEWESWKALHRKSYAHKMEDLERNGVWARNKEFVDSHNVENGGGSYTLAVNRFGDMVWHAKCGGPLIKDTAQLLNLGWGRGRPLIKDITQLLNLEGGL